jgi:hypothetical protein
MITATALCADDDAPGPCAVFYAGMVRKKERAGDDGAEPDASVALIISILWVIVRLFSLVFVGDGPWLGYA